MPIDYQADFKTSLNTLKGGQQNRFLLYAVALSNVFISMCISRLF